ncbi:MAG: dihydrofolate reductase [Luteimonas sp.]
MRLVLIAALDRHRAIGQGNALPWQLPDDLKRFKALTLGKPVLMGRKTAESLGRALPKRRNLVLTRSRRTPFAGMQAVASLDDALTMAGDGGADELCVIGGAEVYALTLPHADMLHLTHVEVSVTDADTWFPAFDPGQWRVEMREERQADARHAFDFAFVDYTRLHARIAVCTEGRV